MDPELASLFSLTGRSAVVTGGATGLGEEIARVLSRAGAHVVIADIDLVGARRVAAELDGDAVALDVTDPESASEVISAIEGLDLLVNNAGSYRDNGSILDQDYEAWRRNVTVNFDGVFVCSQVAARAMVASQRPGTIINIASVDGILPCLGTAYDSAKAAVIQFTKTLAVDLAPHHIRVNAVAPGNVPVPTLQRIQSGELPPLWPPASSVTGLMGPLMRQRSANIPLGRLGQPRDIALAVMFLASAAASYVTGQTLVVDGGWTLV
jgi:NAD(P)-dependent dehydrogenase (short-subunit alcohol dehydrogenase family)